MRNFLFLPICSTHSQREKIVCTCTGSFFDLVFMILRRQSLFLQKEFFYLRFEHVAVTCNFHAKLKET